jgi:hypothetical protein
MIAVGIRDANVENCICTRRQRDDLLRTGATFCLRCSDTVAGVVIPPGVGFAVGDCCGPGGSVPVAVGCVVAGTVPVTVVCSVPDIVPVASGCAVAGTVPVTVGCGVPEAVLVASGCTVPDTVLVAVGCATDVAVGVSGFSKQGPSESVPSSWADRSPPAIRVSVFPAGVSFRAPPRHSQGNGPIPVEPRFATAPSTRLVPNPAACTAPIADTTVVPGLSMYLKTWRPR